MIKKIMLSVLLAFLVVSPAMAGFTPDVVILEKKDITTLSDEKLIDAYMDALVDLEALKSFHTTAGYTIKDYKDYKSLLKFRLQLLMEIHNRNLEVPQFDRYSN